MNRTPRMAHPYPAALARRRWFITSRIICFFELLQVESSCVARLPSVHAVKAWGVARLLLRESIYCKRLRSRAWLLACIKCVM
jgi:hypothetical protein